MYEWLTIVIFQHSNPITYFASNWCTVQDCITIVAMWTTKNEKVDVCLMIFVGDRILLCIIDRSIKAFRSPARPFHGRPPLHPHIKNHSSTSKKIFLHFHQNVNNKICSNIKKKQSSNRLIWFADSVWRRSQPNDARNSGALFGRRNDFVWWIAGRKSHGHDLHICSIERCDLRSVALTYVRLIAHTIQRFQRNVIRSDGIL